MQISNRLAKDHLRLGLGLSVLLVAVACTRVPVDPALHYAREMLQQAGRAGRVSLKIDPAWNHPEAFRLERSAGGIRIVAGGPAGALYGVQQVLAAHPVVDAEGRPDFDVRGAVLMMMNSGWAYQSDLSPENYPWFFDRPLMTRYLDYLFSARINTLVIWSGHLFPQILDLPEYPHATRFAPDRIHRNQEQFRWLTTECARRNIRVLTHFYNIHITEEMARHLGRTGDEPTRYTAPDAFVRGYYSMILMRYFATFPNVGLYICPGESLEPAGQLPWFRDVVFKAARDSGKDPQLVIRDWTMADDFKRALPTLYDNLLSELKHNDETIASPWPDVRHRTWNGVLKGHLANLHDPADATPYRVGSPSLIGELVRHWKEEGFIKGGWFYPPQCWCWPYTLDRVMAADGVTSAPLIAFERDDLWHLLEGRYLWRAERDPKGEQAWCADWLGRKFGNPSIGESLTQWYDLTGPILPGLQNMTAVRFGNFFPTAVAPVQADVDAILAARARIDDAPLSGVMGLTGQRFYSRPIDAFTVELYQQWYGITKVKDLRSMPVAQYAELVATGGDSGDYIAPDKLIDLYLEMANRSLAIARATAALPSNNPDELQRFVHDSQALVYTVEYYRHKVLAALEKRLLERTGDPRHAAAFKEHLELSVAKYRQMAAYAGRQYTAASSMFAARTWQKTFTDVVQVDERKQLEWLKEYEAKR